MEVVLDTVASDAAATLAFANAWRARFGLPALTALSPHVPFADQVHPDFRVRSGWKLEALVYPGLVTGPLPPEVRRHLHRAASA